MRRGDLYRIRRPGDGDPKKSRVFVVVSRQTLIDSRFSSVICAPVYTRREGLATEVEVGIEEGLKHPSGILCDALVSLSKSRLMDFVGSLSEDRLQALGAALRVALAVEQSKSSFADESLH
ncbi:MAG: type II toxin-antitoxin system PemK/MazF family toxin [bacterium]|nr:type II toxin-antitoxin system PemK/MazF family toxin [bacterium]